MTARSWPARLDRTKDGDTYVLLVDRGDDDTSKWTVRLKGVDTPELSKKETHDAAVKAAQAATAYLTANPSNVSWPLTLVTEQTAEGSLQREKYGRFLANIILADGTVLAERLIADGFAKPWDGQGPHPWLLSPPPVKMILDLIVHGEKSDAGYVPKLFQGDSRFTD